MAIAGGQKAGRRRGGKGAISPSTPADVGATLRDARDADGVTMADVHDRTGISWGHLEALESGELSRFPDRRTALVYLGRYADLFGLDFAELAPAIEKHWPDEVMAGARQESAGTKANSNTTASSSYGHLSRFPGDQSHLLSFSQTAQVPGVRAAPIGSRPSYDDGYAMLAGGNYAPYAPYSFPRPAPMGLRMAVWFTGMLVVLGGIGLAAHKWDPQLLTSLHLVKSTQTPTSTPPAQSHTTTPVVSPPVTIPTVTETSTSPQSGTFEVNAAEYSVVISPTAPVWTKVAIPGAATPLFEGTLVAGETKTFDAGSGPLQVNLGSSRVALTVQISGKTVSGWSFTPTVVPFTAMFSPSPTA